MAGNLRPLRGRVAVREIVPTHYGVLVLPDTYADSTRASEQSRGGRAQSSHRGRVLGFGPPALQYGHEVPHLFSIGDDVVFVYGAGLVERGRRSTWTDDGPCVWVTQEEVLAVVQP